MYVTEYSQFYMQSNSTPIKRYSGNCSQYEGICSVYLKPLIAPNNTLTTMVHSDITEQQVSSFLANLKNFPDIISKECSAAIMPFLCQYVYPPCDSNGSTQFITQEQCINIREGVCESEWKFAMATKFGSLLPFCEAFDANNNLSLIVEGMNISSKISNCHYQFKKFCGVCLPLCGSFSQYSAPVKLSERILIIIAAVLAIIGGIIVLIAAIIRRKEM